MGASRGCWTHLLGSYDGCGHTRLAVVAGKGGGGGVCKANGRAAWLRGPPADPEHELLGTLFGSCHVTPTSKSSRLG